MTKFLLSLHVLAAIVAVGPVTVAASMFPPAARRAAPGGGAGASDAARATVTVLHRVCRVYARVGIAVPVLGLATALAMGVLGDGWLIASIALTAAAAGLLIALGRAPPGGHPGGLGAPPPGGPPPPRATGRDNRRMTIRWVCI
ncbi:hypothetical protein [Streptomyces sp. NPDC054826]